MIIFITGLPGSGKSSYIQQHFSCREEYYVFDLSLQGKRLFGSPMALEDENKIADVYNKTSEEALFALMDGKHLVIEFGKGNTYHDEFERIKKMAKGIGLRIEEIYFDRVYSIPDLSENTDHYYSSFLYAYESLEVLEGVLESYGINQDLDCILELVTENGFLKMLSMCNDQGDTVYFYVTEKTDAFDFGDDEFDKPEGVEYRQIFDSFEEAVASMMNTTSVLKISPVRIVPEYVEEFQKIYDNHLSKHKKPNSPLIFYAPLN